MLAVESLTRRFRKLMPALALAGAVTLVGCGPRGAQTPEANPPAAAAASPTPGATVTEAVTAAPTETPPPTLTPTPTPGPGLDELLLTPQAAYTNADLEGAAEGYAELATLYPQAAEPWIGQAEVALREGDADAALEYLQAAVSAEPGDFEAWRLLAVLYEQREDYEQAAQAYGEMIGIAPDDPNLYVARAMARARIGQSAEAAADLLRAQTLDPYRDYAWLNVAGAAYGSRSYETAIEILNAGIEAHPSSTDLLLLRGRALLTVGNAEAALADFDAAAAVDGQSLAAHYGRGAALDALGRADEAITAFQHAGELGATAGAGSLSEAFEAMAQAARIMARTNPSAAYAYLQERSITYGQPPEILLGYALIERERGNATAALDSLNRLIETYSYLPAYYWRGKINAEIGNSGPARNDLNEYLKISQAGPEAEDAYVVLESIGG